MVPAEHEKIAEISVSLAMIREQLQPIIETISELNKSSTTHTILIDMLIKNVEKIQSNIDLLVETQHSFKRMNDDIVKMISEIEHTKTELTQFKLKCEENKIKIDSSGKISTKEILNYIPKLISIISFIAVIAWALIKTNIGGN